MLPSLPRPAALESLPLAVLLRLVAVRNLGDHPYRVLFPLVFVLYLLCPPFLTRNPNFPGTVASTDAAGTG